jgi:Tfp pilus assembly protein PilO
MSMQTLKNQSARYGPMQSAMGVLALVLLAVFYFAAIRPADQRRAAAVVGIQAQKSQLVVNQREAAKLPGVRVEVRRLKNQLDGLDKKLPKRPDTDQFGREITQVSEQCSLKKVNMQVGAPRRADVVSEMPIALNFTGDFESVIAFLQQTEDLQRLTRVRSLSIKSRDAPPGARDGGRAQNIYFADE